MIPTTTIPLDTHPIGAPSKLSPGDSKSHGPFAAATRALLPQGSPLPWLTSLARKRALHRAILRYLIGAHLDDLRALEGPAAGRSVPPRSVPDWRNDFLWATRGSLAGGWPGDKPSWTDAVVALLTGRACGGDGAGAAEGHLGTIMTLVRDITCRSSTVSSGSSAQGAFGMTAEEALEVVTEAKRRLPAPTPGSASDFQGEDGRNAERTAAWGSGGTGAGMRLAPWPWPPRGVPLSAVGALVALAAALPPAGNLIAGVDVMLQITAEVVAAAKADAAVAAGVAAAAASASRGGSKRPQAFVAGGRGAQSVPDYASAMVEEVAQAAERTMLMYVGEYCGRHPMLWETVTNHARRVLPVLRGEGADGASAGAKDGGGGWTVRLVGSLLRSCGQELGGADLVRALPEELSLMECLDEVERGLLEE